MYALLDVSGADDVCVAFSFSFVCVTVSTATAAVLFLLLLWTLSGLKGGNLKAMT